MDRIRRIPAALNHVRQFHPEVHMVVFNIQGQWHYMSKDFVSPTFDKNIDVDILQAAADAVYEMFGYPYVYQMPDEDCD